MSPWDSMKQKYPSKNSTVLELIGSIEASQIHKTNTDEEKVTMCNINFMESYCEVQTAQHRKQQAYPCVSWFLDRCLTYLKTKKKKKNDLENPVKHVFQCMIC